MQFYTWVKIIILNFIYTSIVWRKNWLQVYHDALCIDYLEKHMFEIRYGFLLIFTDFSKILPEIML
jgi:hypothetical protein